MRKLLFIIINSRSRLVSVRYKTSNALMIITLTANANNGSRTMTRAIWHIRISIIKMSRQHIRMCPINYSYYLSIHSNSSVNINECVLTVRRSTIALDVIISVRSHVSDYDILTERRLTINVNSRYSEEMLVPPLRPHELLIRKRTRIYTLRHIHRYHQRIRIAARSVPDYW